jgi:hypothetical protein
VFTDNPVTEFVELPDELRELRYCALLAGVVRGALEQVGWLSVTAPSHVWEPHAAYCASTLHLRSDLLAS